MLQYFWILSDSLIPIMGFALVFALFLRYVAYHTCGVSHAYINTLARSIEKILATFKYEPDLDLWLKNLINKVEEALPSRSIRFGAKKGIDRLFHKNAEGRSFADFKSIRKNILTSICQQSDSLRNSSSPNFIDLAQRVLSQEPYWQRIFRIIPVDTLQRLLAIMPSLFVIGGIFGTFIGITSALPIIAKIDLNNIETATPILNQFVSSVAFSMQTSIAGILFSVILTLLNTIFPLATIRGEVEERMAGIFELLWHHIHKGQISEGDARIIERLDQLVRAIERNQPKK